MSEDSREPPRFPLRLDRLSPAAPARRGAERRPAGTAAAAPPPPSGLGLDSQQVRARMVERLAAEGLRDARVLDAMRAVPRHLFVDSALANQAYEDTSLPIGLGQTISKPSVVARMIELMLAPRPAGTRPARLLEIGSGCGYQAAVLAQIGCSVVSIERLRPLHDRARERLAALRVANVRLVYGDGRLGHAANAPYDGIVAAAGGEDLPEAWIAQLAPGGRLVAPMHDAAHGGQVLMVVDRFEDGRVRRSRHEAVRFVPLKSGVD